jgi:hypothetical protein
MTEPSKTQPARPNWGIKDYFSFLDLSEEIGEGGTVLHPRYKTVEDALDARRKHPIGAWLFQNPDFRKAWERFKRLRKGAFKRLRKGATEGPLTGPTAELIFLRLVCGRRSIVNRVYGGS